MPDERDIAHDKKVMEEHEGEKLEIIGAHPQHAPQPGKKTPQTETKDKEAIDESGNLIHDDKDENDAK